VSEPQVFATREDPIGRITLNRPEAMNAVTIELARQLEQALKTLAPAVDVIVIRGAGGNFSVGGDFKQVEQLRAQGPEELRALFEAFSRACAAVGSVEVPVLAAVEGYALAGGFELMQACDVSIVREDARIGDHHANSGVIPGGGGSQRLPRLVGRQRALGMILTGGHISGLEAVAWGLAYGAAPEEQFDQAVEDLARQLAGRSRRAQAAIKRLVREGLELPLTEGLAQEQDQVVEFLTNAEREVEWQRS
jgi:enoyl-CoA hydratase/carnithine racemase